MAEAAEVEAMGDGETRRQLEAAVAWLRANGRPELDIAQARREALHDWLGAQWAEHNRSEPFLTRRSGRSSRLERLVELAGVVTGSGAFGPPR
jgi:hypothetical protein